MGRRVEAVRCFGKWLSIHFSGDLILLTHMLMNGIWHIYRPAERWRRSRDDMRIIVATPDFVAVAFNVQIAEFHTEKSLAQRSAVARLGPDVLSQSFDENEAIAQLRPHPEMEIGEALLQQTLLAGLGNVYKSEICFACRVNPFRVISTLTESELKCLIKTAKKYLLANVTDTSFAQIVTYTGFRRTTGRANRADRLWVYGRAGEPCRRCGTPIERSKQASNARVTFWCPECQTF